MSRSRFPATAATSCSPAITATDLRRLLTGTPQAARQGAAPAGSAWWARRCGSACSACCRSACACRIRARRFTRPPPCCAKAGRAPIARWSARGTSRRSLVKHGVELKGAVFDASLAAKLPGCARPHAISRRRHLSAGRHSHQGRSREHGGRARSAGAAARPSRRGTDVAAAVASHDASRQEQMAAASGALPPRAEASGRAAEDGFHAADRTMAQRSVAPLGGGAVVGEAPRRRRAARPGSHLGAVAASISTGAATGISRCGRC